MEGVANKSVELLATTRKLAIVIEKLEDDAGHVISTIKPDSALIDLVEPGDCIVGVGAVDTRKLSGASLTHLLLKQCAATSGSTILHLVANQGSSTKNNISSENSSPDSVRHNVSMEERGSTVAETTASNPAPCGAANIRTVVAPPGKLGVVLAKTDAGHTITTVKPGSVLEKMVVEGDTIVGVNEKDTDQLSVVALTALLARTERESRTFSIVTRDAESAETRIDNITEEEKEPENPLANLVPFEVPETGTYRSVDVPEGNLGLVLDKVESGHLVSQLKAGSQLAGMISQEDVIVAFNGLDTRQISIVALTSLMSRASKDPCVLTLLVPKDEKQKFLLEKGTETSTSNRSLISI